MLEASPSPPPSLDTRLRIETPEGIDLILRPAGLVVRALAFSLDLGVRGLLMVGIYTLFSRLDQLGVGLTAIALFLLNWWYPVLFEVLNQGRTPGKQIMGLRVVHDDGTPVGWASSLIRNLLRVVDMLPFGYALGAVASLNHAHFKRLGDLAAGTLVTYRDQPLQRPLLPEATPWAAPFALTLEEQRAIIELAERQAELSTARTHELAAHLAEPLCVPHDQAVARLNGIARALVGPA